MATKKVELLLNRTIENLGLVGDVVKVKPGFARNYLLPHAFVTRALISLKTYFCLNPTLTPGVIEATCSVLASSPPLRLL